MDQMTQMEITYMDGTSQVFEWDPSFNQASPFNQVSQLQKALNEDYILLEVEGELVMIPKQNIKMLKVNVSPSALPSSAIKGARKVS